MSRNKGWRRWKRYVKGMRRIKQDRMEHNLKLRPGESPCLCFGVGDKGEVGRVFARFADYPAACPCAGCTRRRADMGPTYQELRKNQGDE